MRAILFSVFALQLLAVSGDPVLVGEQPVLVGLAPANTSRGLPLLGFGTELVWQSTNDTGLLASADVAAGGAVARYPGGTPSNYWDWGCSRNGTCCTEDSLTKGQAGKCTGSMGIAPTGVEARALTPNS